MGLIDNMYKDFRPGGLAEGKSHAQSGIKMYQAGGDMAQPTAEIEGAGATENGIIAGGERVFSVDDTAAIEQLVQAYNAAQDPQQKAQIAMQGMDAITQMIITQEQVNPSASGIQGDTSMQQPAQGPGAPMDMEEINAKYGAMIARV